MCADTALDFNAVDHAWHHCRDMTKPGLPDQNRQRTGVQTEPETPPAKNPRIPWKSGKQPRNSDNSPSSSPFKTFKKNAEEIDTVPAENVKKGHGMTLFNRNNRNK